MLTRASKRLRAGFAKKHLSSSSTQVNSGSANYPHLLSPLQLHDGVTLKNRVLMGSMHTGLEESGGVLLHGDLDQMAAFYAERAKGDVGIIVTGGISPNNAGRAYFMGSKLSTEKEAKCHKVVTQAVHENGGKIALQIMHTGRYAYHPWNVSASEIKAPIGWFTPKALSSAEVHQTIDDFAKCAALAQSAGYDGVEVMGSEGYLINQFLVKRTNHRTDEWGGSYANRKRLAIEVVKRIRAATGPRFIIIYRLSMLDLVEDGSSWEEIVELAHDIKAAGASIINTGIGWHEARVPTIATMVPRGAFSWVTGKLKQQLPDLPLCTTNRINAPDTAEDIIASGSADMVSMARPLLADPYFVAKAAQGRAEQINTCIGCNQACLDHIFVKKRASCLVNPRAGHEHELVISPAKVDERMAVAVVGAGPAGLACALTAAQRGHHVTLFDKEDRIGGQFNLAKQIPGKEEFHETLRYFEKMLAEYKVDVRLGCEVHADYLISEDYGAVVLATGVVPRHIGLSVKTDKVKVFSYYDLLKNHFPVGSSVAVIGAGGIGFDVADYITHGGSHHGSAQPVPASSPKPTVDKEAVQAFLNDWGIDQEVRAGGLKKPEKVAAPRKVYLLQRKPGRLGSTLGKTTGWIHRATLKKRQVEEISGCKYIEVNDDGLVIERAGQRTTLPVDTVILCAGQEPLRTLEKPLVEAKKKVFLIGGSLLASELDAKRAIDQGTRLAAVIEKARSGDVFNAPVPIQTKLVNFLESLFVKKP